MVGLWMTRDRGSPGAAPEPGAEAPGTRTRGSLLFIMQPRRLPGMLSEMRSHQRPQSGGHRRGANGNSHLIGFWALLLLVTSCGGAPPAGFTELAPGIGYTNVVTATVPWSIHVVRVDRNHASLGLHSRHAHGGALGLDTLSGLLTDFPTAAGTPVAAVNGDFYQREHAYAGDPRGLQVVEGELISAPAGRVAFWIDAAGQPRTGPVASQLSVRWPDGTALPLGLNEETKPDAAVLYTSAAGSSTRTTGGREFIVEPDRPDALPLRPNATLITHVRKVHDGGNAPLAAGTLVVSLGPVKYRKLPKIDAGAELRLSTATLPVLEDIQTAISGGPLLVQNGRPLKIQPASSESYESSSMTERHPRTALGWNRNYLYLVEVDGRQPLLSAGMTLAELGKYLAGLGCDEALNLDGGGSATLWVMGKVRNHPCDGHERPIANALVVTQKRMARP